MTATAAATQLNYLIRDGAAPRKVVLGEHRLTSKQGAEHERPYFRLLYQQMGEPTAIPGRRRGLLSVYCYGKTPEEAWHEANKLTDTLKLVHDRPMLSPAKAIAHYALYSGWERMPDPTDGGLVTCAIEFHYDG